MYPKIKNIPKQQKQQAAFCRIALRDAWVLPRPHPSRSPCDRSTFKIEGVAGLPTMPVGSVQASGTCQETRGLGSGGLPPDPVTGSWVGR